MVVTRYKERIQDGHNDADKEEVGIPKVEGESSIEAKHETRLLSKTFCACLCCEELC